MEKIFKNLVIASAVAWVTYIIFITLYPNSLLSEELAAIRNANFDKLDDMFGLFMILIIIVVFVSYYLIYKFKKIGRTIFLMLVLITVPLGFYMGPQILSPFDYLFEYLISVLDGALLTLMYVSPLKDRFR